MYKRQDYASDYDDDYRDDHDPYNGGSGSNENSTSAENNIETGTQFVDSLQNGDINVTLSSELLSSLAQVGDVTGFTSDVLESLKGNSSLLGTIGGWLSRYALGYSTISVIMGLTDGETSPRDLVNLGATILGVAGIWVPPLGVVSFIVATAANAVPGDQGRQDTGSNNGQY